jgi:hypothetical protein
MKKVISIFCLPREIDDLDRTITQLRNNIPYLEEPDDWYLDVKMNVGDDMVIWNDSKLPKEFFVQKFETIGRNCGFENASFKLSEEIKGCVSQRVDTLEKYNKFDYFIWLDTDIIFSSETLAYFETTIRNTAEEYPYSIITPEIVRIWDTTWDCLVNEKFIDKPLNYHKTNNPYQDCGMKGMLKIESVHNQANGQPRFKFAGGWFTCISGKLLRRVGVPKSLGHYGLEDTFIMWGAEKLTQLKQITAYQFKIKGLVICENYKFRDSSYITDNLKSIDRKNEFLTIANQNFKVELDLLQ